MYFSIKAFRSTTRRFENLDNIEEVNTFVHEYIAMGYNKFILHCYDESGALGKVFYHTDHTGWLTKLAKITY
jgi:hypothetical protein